MKKETRKINIEKAQAKSFIKRSKKRKVSMLKIVGVVAILATIIFCLYKASAFMYKEAGSYVAQVKEKYIAESNKNIESKTPKIIEDKDIISFIARHIELPNEDVNVFVRVKDPDVLASRSNFYKDLKKDDYIVVYPSLAVIYDAKTDKVLKSSPTK